MGGRARHGSVGWGPERDAGARARQGGQDVLSVMGQLLIGLLIP